MQKTQRIIAIVLLLLVAASVYGIWRTRQSASPPKAKQAVVNDKSLVDQSPLKTAQQVAQLASTHDERQFVQEALRLANYDVDIAFENAIRQARLHPPALSAEGKEAEAREQKAESVLEAEQDRAKQLTEAESKAPLSKKESIERDLLQVQANMGLAQDELDDAKHALRREGGDLVGRLEQQQEHYKARSKEITVPTGPEQPDQPGLIHRIAQWRQLHQKQMQLWQAKSDTEAGLVALAAKHDALDAQIDDEKAGIPELSRHSRKTTTEPVPANVPAVQKTQEENTTLLKRTQELAENQKVLSAFNKRMDTKKQLEAEYSQWIDLVAAQQRTVLHRALYGVAIILAIALIGLSFSSWTDSLLKKLSIDRRQVESLRTVARVSLQVLALCMILLVLLGPPGQLGTFLGLAGAGLTVALKDFIVSFLGWFVLMGKNGVRLGDWVEINGVTGEVVQIGPFHTVLMETGNWTDSGHPTGRRVTFTNGYAIEGHYFNFSTSGQWLWDELQVVLPAGQDPYPLVDAIHKKVVQATRESAQLAEQEWRKAGKSRDLSGISAEPAISVKPVLGGIEMSVRYITRAAERYKLRAQLYQDAVELLGGKAQVEATK